MNKILLISIIAVIFSGCKKDADSIKSPDGTTTSDFSRLYEKMYNIVSIDTTNNKTITIKTLDMPDHKTPFYGTGHSKYETYNGDNPGFDTKINFNGTLYEPTVQQQYISFSIPRYPTVAAAHESTSIGPIGIARNGVVFYSQHDSEGDTISALGINNVDQYLGHPSINGGRYHYHFEPRYLTSNYGTMGFMGFLLDGFPVYGPYENGEKVKQADLDSYNGHVGHTVDYPDEMIYHYHIISSSSSIPSALKQAAPYINGGKFYGTKGSVN